MFDAMDIQVFRIRKIKNKNFYGAACKRADCPEMLFIFLNDDLPAAEQIKTLRHEVWHCLQMERGTDKDDQAEAEAATHEDDTALDEIISSMKLMENALIFDVVADSYRLFTAEGIEVSTAAAGSRHSKPQQARTCRIDDWTAADVK